MADPDGTHPTKEPLPANVLVHGRPALCVEANPNLPERIVLGPAAEWLSSQWEGETDPLTIERWLACAIPENGMLESWTEAAEAKLNLRLGLSKRPRNPDSLLWTHSEHEFPGAMSIGACGDMPPPPVPVPVRDYHRVDDSEVKSLLRHAVARSSSPIRQLRDGREWRHPSLLGMRPKTSLTENAEGNGWCFAPVGSLNTWIVKVEDDRQRPGEAGMESICQRALAEAGLRAAETRAQLIEGHQCVLSRRADRRMADGMVAPVHQEDYRQAAGLPLMKFPSGIDGRELGWARAYALLRSGAADPDSECDELTRQIASACLLGHSDLHRGNFGYHVSAPDEGPRRISLAPAYDFSSCAGTDITTNIPLGVGGQVEPSKMQMASWQEHARSCGLDFDRTLRVVLELADIMPDALATARRKALDSDEDREPLVVTGRYENAVGHAARMSSEFKRKLRRGLNAKGGGPSL